MGIDKCNALFVGLHSNHGKYGSKNFISVNTHIGLNMIKERWSKPETTRLTIHHRISSINDKCCSIGNSSVNISLYLVAMSSGNKWTHIASATSISCTKLRHLLCNLLHKFITDGINCEHNGNRHAAFAS